jgi:hypothetical protein
MRWAVPTEPRLGWQPAATDPAAGCGSDADVQTPLGRASTVPKLAPTNPQAGMGTDSGLSTRR